jgi:hypothetical protein
MPNPSTEMSRLEEQYTKHEALSRDLSLSKSTREAHLQAARRLAAELGIDGPPNYNGRSPQTAEDKVSFTIHLSSRELRSVQAALRLAQIEYQTFVSGPFGGEQPLSFFELGDLLVRIDGGE